MVSNVKYPKFPAIGVRSARGILGLVVHLVVLIGGVLRPEYVLFPLGLLYMVFGLSRATVLGLMERPEPGIDAEQPSASPAQTEQQAAASPRDRRGWADRRKPPEER
jgi:hypothetical protein